MALENSALFFDHFGFLIWIFLLWIAIVDLKNPKLVKWPRYVLLWIGIIGIILDGVLLIGLYAGFEFIKYAWFFDHFGIPVFLFIIWLSWKDLKNVDVKRKVSKYLLFLLGIGGLIADGFILYMFYSSL